MVGFACCSDLSYVDCMSGVHPGFGVELLWEVPGLDFGWRRGCCMLHVFHVCGFGMGEAHKSYVLTVGTGPSNPSLGAEAP